MTAGAASADGADSDRLEKRRLDDDEDEDDDDEDEDNDDEKDKNSGSNSNSDSEKKSSKSGKSSKKASSTAGPTVVSGSLAADATVRSGYATIQDSVDAAPGWQRFVIFIPAGMYNERVLIKTTDIVLIGAGADKTIITGDASYSSGYGTFDSAYSGRG
ncbi:hypothetical protein CLOP_g12085 [Closterium sp. NIES-67]|nr:hypothetical protein CLOP_g12085 [Closterium sp. NIES-67]